MASTSDFRLDVEEIAKTVRALRPLVQDDAPQVFFTFLDPLVETKINGRMSRQNADYIIAAVVGVKEDFLKFLSEEEYDYILAQVKRHKEELQIRRPNSVSFGMNPPSLPPFGSRDSLGTAPHAQLQAMFGGFFHPTLPSPPASLPGYQVYPGTTIHYQGGLHGLGRAGLPPLAYGAMQPTGNPGRGGLGFNIQGRGPVAFPRNPTGGLFHGDNASVVSDVTNATGITGASIATRHTAGYGRSSWSDTNRVIRQDQIDDVRREVFGSDWRNISRSRTRPSGMIVYSCQWNECKRSIRLRPLDSGSFMLQEHTKELQRTHRGHQVTNTESSGGGREGATYSFPSRGLPSPLRDAIEQAEEHLGDRDFTVDSILHRLLNNSQVKDHPSLHVGHLPELKNRLKNYIRQRAKRQRTDTDEPLGTEPTIEDVLQWCGRYTYSLPPNKLPVREFADYDAFKTFLGKTDTEMSQRIFLRVPSKEVVEGYLGGRTLTNTEWANIAGCVPWTSLHGIWTLYWGHNRIPPGCRCRMFDGTGGLLNDRSMVVQTGYVSTRVNEYGNVSNTFDSDCFVLCRSGEDSASVVCLMASLQEFANHIFGRDASSGRPHVDLRPDYAIMDFTSALSNGLQTMYPGHPPKAIRCYFHRMAALRKNRNNLGLRDGSVYAEVQEDLRDIHNCITYSQAIEAERWYLGQWRNKGLNLLADNQLSQYGSNSGKLTWHKMAVPFPGIKTDNNPLESDFGRKKRSTAGQLYSSVGKFLAKGTQDLCGMNYLSTNRRDVGRHTQLGPALIHPSDLNSAGDHAGGESATPKEIIAVALLLDPVTDVREFAVEGSSLRDVLGSTFPLMCSDVRHLFLVNKLHWTGVEIAPDEDEKYAWSLQGDVDSLGGYLNLATKYRDRYCCVAVIGNSLAYQTKLTRFCCCGVFAEHLRCTGKFKSDFCGSGTWADQSDAHENCR